jgi:hypothetical protein
MREGLLVLRAGCTAALLALSILGGASHAHSDRVLAMHGSGQLSGLPEEFGPAELRVAFASDGGGPKITSMQLRLGKARTLIPPCVCGILQSSSYADIRVKGSWYHEESGLPYYLHVDFADPDARAEARWKPGFSMLFNLRTAKLIRMDIQVLRENGNAVQFVPVDVRGLCPEEEVRRLMDGSTR